MLSFLPFSKKEKFLLVNIASGGTKSVLLSLDKDRNLKAQNAKQRNGRPKFSPKGMKVIIAVEPKFAHTILTPLAFERDADGKALGAIELENLLAQAVGKVFNGHRKEASEALGADELDVMVAKSRVDAITVDGHQVMNPVGFEAKEIRAMLEMTFTPRAVFSRAKEFLGGASDFFFTETGRAELAALAKVAEKKTIRLAAVGKEESYLFSTIVSASSAHITRRALEWGTRMLVKALAAHWFVSESAAHALYRGYLKGEIGENVRRDFEKVFTEEIDSLLNAIGPLKPTGNVYLEGDDIPFALLEKRSKAFSKPPVAAFLEASGFSIGSQNGHADSETLFRTLAPFFEFYYDKSDTQVNHWLRRRLHWLGSAT